MSCLTTEKLGSSRGLPVQMNFVSITEMYSLQVEDPRFSNEQKSDEMKTISRLSSPR